MPRILIRFHDNDYGNALLVVGWALRQAPWREYTTHADLCVCINALFPAIVSAHAALVKHTVIADPGYFYVREDRVFVGSAVDREMATVNTWGNGAAVLVERDGTVRLV